MIQKFRHALSNFDRRRPKRVKNPTIGLSHRHGGFEHSTSGAKRLTLANSKDTAVQTRGSLKRTCTRLMSHIDVWKVSIPIGFKGWARGCCVGRLELPRVRCFAACLLVDHGRSLLAFCMTNERALRRDVFAADASTKRNSC
jgi:hypothetical protein